MRGFVTTFVCDDVLAFIGSQDELVRYTKLFDLQCLELRNFDGHGESLECENSLHHEAYPEGCHNDEECFNGFVVH